MTRRHDIDALRIIAFALLILYHTAMAYVDEWGFHLKGSFTTDALQWPMRLLNGWRMSLLFLISGVAIALTRNRLQRGRFILKRTWRLLLPLAFGMLVVVPIQPYCEGVSRGMVAPGFWEFLLRYWQVRPWPEGSFAGDRFGITWNHLWYLAYLWVYTTILAIALPVLDSAPLRSASQRFANAPGWMLIGLPALLLLLWLVWLAPSHPATNTLVDDVHQHAKFGTVFLVGYLLGREPRFWERVEALRWATLATVLGAVAWYLFLEALGRWLPPASPLRQWPEPFWRLQSQYCEVVYSWGMLLTLLGWGKHCLDRPFPWLPYCTEAIYPWYVLHQSLMIAVLFWLKPMQLGPWMEPALVLLGTVGGCLLLHELLIRRSCWLRPLFGLKSSLR
ncbi:acyltransferase [Stenotrophomonas sp. G106K1]|uniref:acyltransferase family protein n=1 Tax=Stenotrophomonas sp. G106K1 TaxID=3134792 RepID=UPI0030F409E1